MIKLKMVTNMVSDTITQVLKDAINGSIMTNQDFTFEKGGLGTEEFAKD